MQDLSSEIHQRAFSTTRPRNCNVSSISSHFHHNWNIHIVSMYRPHNILTSNRGKSTSFLINEHTGTKLVYTIVLMLLYYHKAVQILGQPLIHVHSERQHKNNVELKAKHRCHGYRNFVFGVGSISKEIRYSALAFNLTDSSLLNLEASNLYSTGVLSMSVIFIMRWNSISGSRSGFSFFCIFLLLIVQNSQVLFNWDGRQGRNILATKRWLKKTPVYASSHKL